MKWFNVKWSTRARQLESLVGALDSLGYFQYAGDAQNARIATLARGDIYADETGRVFFADAEYIYESGADMFMQTISTFLRAADSPVLEFGEIEERGLYYDIVLNGRRFRIISAEDEKQCYPWSAPAVRLFRAINGMLEEAGSEECMYYDQIGNDTMVVFLSGDMYRAIAESDAVLGGHVRLLNRP
ncbi:MAG: hypothetical protein GY835_23580 [bacterium]|nr:hypothetical protein [bacterium]